MKWLDLTLATPAENLACDEALLDLCEEAGVEILRFWESRQPFVVVGYGNRFMTEVNFDECRRQGVPILRRCSGGGTVVQGPGCLNYNLTLRIPEGGPLATVTGTNEYVMERNRAELEKLLGGAVTVQGYTDLAWASPVAHRLGACARGEGGGQVAPGPWLKFSGNAQRRRRRSLVFHGTILHQFDLSLIDGFLKFPSAQPEYRRNRSHAEFVCNIPATASQIRAALREGWNADDRFEDVPEERIRSLCTQQYGNDAWNFRR